MATRRVKLAVAGALALLVLSLVPAVTSWREGAERTFDLGVPATCLRFSPDGSSIGALSSTGLLRVWSVDTEALLLERRLPVHTPDRLELSPDLESIAVVESHDADVMLLYRVSDSSLLGRLPAPTWAALEFSPDGRRLLALTRDGLQVWSLPSCSLLLSKPFEPGNYGLAATFGPRGEILSIDAHGRASVWTAAGQLVRELDLAVEDAIDTTFSQDGSACVFRCRGERSIRVVRATDGAALLRLTSDAAFGVLSPSADLLAVSCWDGPEMHGRVEVHSVITGRRLGWVPGWWSAFSPRSPWFAWSSATDTKVHLIPLDRVGRWRHLREKP